MARAEIGPPERMNTRRDFLAALGAAGAVASLGAQETASRDVATGQHKLKLAEGDRDGLYYIPAKYQAGVRAPLWVVLHGAGGTAQSTQYMFALADDFGVILLAPDSRDERTWDGVLMNWGPDVEFIAAAVGHVSHVCSVNRDRVTVAGFSDGATYALSLGISYGDVFRKVFAGAPGVMQPIEANGKPPIFLAHGRQDPTMPIDETSRKFLPKLKALEYDVTYREYEGRHTLPPEILREVFEWLTRK